MIHRAWLWMGRPRSLLSIGSMRTTRRWVSRPGSAVDVTNPQGWNRYAYVLNNPASWVDPSGMCPPGYQSGPNGDGCVPIPQNPSTSWITFDVCGTLQQWFPGLSLQPCPASGQGQPPATGVGTGSMIKTICTAGVLWRPGLAPSANGTMQAAKQFTSAAGKSVGQTGPRALIDELGPLRGQPAMESVGRTWTSEVWEPLANFVGAVAEGSMGMDVALPFVLEPQLPKALRPACPVGPPS
jgi:hypothetical protein